MFDRRFLIALPIALPIAVLAACGDKPEQAAGATSGQILPGSTSDDMLPVDTITSQPPMMAPEPDKASPVANGSAAPSEAASEEAADETPAPAATEAAAE
ncbi:MAG: hypothetical protein WA842_12160 [Croceibacterium sp.]